MAVKFFKNYEVAQAARVIEITPEVYGSKRGWCMVTIRVGDTSIEVDRKDFEAFSKEFSRATAEAIAEYERQINAPSAENLFRAIEKKVGKESK